MYIRKNSIAWKLKHNKDDIIGSIIIIVIIVWVLISCFQVAYQNDDGVPIWNMWKLITMMGR